MTKNTRIRLIRSTPLQIFRTWAGLSRLLLRLDSLGFSSGWALATSTRVGLSASSRVGLSRLLLELGSQLLLGLGSRSFYSSWAQFLLGLGSRLLLLTGGCVYLQGAPMPKSDIVLCSSDKLNLPYLLG